MSTPVDDVDEDANECLHEAWQELGGSSRVCEDCKEYIPPPQPQQRLPGERCPKCGGFGLDRKGRLCGYHSPNPELLRRSLLQALSERDAAILRAESAEQAVLRAHRECSWIHRGPQECWRLPDGRTGCGRREYHLHPTHNACSICFRVIEGMQ